MAKEQWKKIGVSISIVGITISIIGSVVGLAYFGGTSVAGVKGDIVLAETTASADRTAIKDNAVEDRAAIAVHTTQIKELIHEQNESKLRDERIAGQYSNIESYMRNESLKTKEIAGDLKDYRKEHEAQVDSNRKEQQSRTEAIIRIQGQIDNLERVD